MNPATSGAPIITSTIVSVRILQTFIFSSPFFAAFSRAGLGGWSRLIRAHHSHRQVASHGKTPPNALNRSPRTFQLEVSFHSVMAKTRITEAAWTRFKVKAHFKMKWSRRQLITVNRWVEAFC
jgi:hypothetical protein